MSDACPVAAAAVVRLTLPDIERLRAAPGPGSAARPQVAKTLRNADEQTVAAIHALLLAMDAAFPADADFAGWGVVGGPRFLGRMTIGGLIRRYFDDPKHSISPHIIPNFCLHSVSGAASVGLKFGGPNFGVGGGPGSVAETLLTGISTMSPSPLAGQGRGEGVWLLLAEADPEPTPDDQGHPTNEIALHAAAIALAREGPARGMLRLIPGTPSPGVGRVKDLAAAAGRPWRCPVPGLGDLELQWADPA